MGAPDPLRGPGSLLILPVGEGGGGQEKQQTRFEVGAPTRPSLHPPANECDDTVFPNTSQAQVRIHAFGIKVLAPVCARTLLGDVSGDRYGDQTVMDLPSRN